MTNNQQTSFKREFGLNAATALALVASVWAAALLAHLCGGVGWPS